MRTSQLLGAQLAALFFGTAVPDLAAQPCQPFWAAGSPSAGTYPVTQFDDGSGPALYNAINDYPYRWREGESNWTRIDAGLPPDFVGFDAQLLILDDGSGPHLCGLGSDTSSGTQAYWVGRWNGQSWERPWPNMRPSNPASEPQASGDVGEGIAIYGITRLNGLWNPGRWAGDHWEPFGNPTGGQAVAINILDDGYGPALYVYGYFTSIGGVPAPGGFARYRNHQWEGLGDGSTLAFPEAVYDDGTAPALYSAGYDSPSGSVRGLVKFDGRRWNEIGQMNPPGAIYFLGDPFVFNDGSGPAIYVYGGFSNMGGVPATGIARYNGHWSTVGDGIHGGSVQSLAAMPTRAGNSLFLSGTFTRAAGAPVQGSARLVACPNCYANCDQSTTPPRLNVNDFMCFLTKFAQSAPEANCDNNATLDVADFMCFLSRFAAGCQ